MHSRTQGFTLVELSIAIVIIGLLVGGIMAGKSLIHSAELQSVVKESKVYSDAVRMFQDTYGGYPGDLPNATDIWGARDGGDGLGTDCTDTAATDKRTCNGDGNWRVTATTRYEYYLFWQHLANAGYIEGQFTGTDGGGASQHIIGENAPASKFPNAGWSAPHFTVLGSSSLKWATDEQMGHTLTVGAESSTFTFGRAFTVLDVYTLDKKMDDGKPGMGLLQTLYWPECSTATANTQAQAEAAEYALDNHEDNQCAIFFPGVINPMDGITF